MDCHCRSSRKRATNAVRSGTLIKARLKIWTVRPWFVKLVYFQMFSLPPCLTFILRGMVVEEGERLVVWPNSNTNDRYSGSLVMKGQCIYIWVHSSPLVIPGRQLPAHPTLREGQQIVPNGLCSYCLLCPSVVSFVHINRISTYILSLCAHVIFLAHKLLPR